VIDGAPSPWHNFGPNRFRRYGRVSKGNSVPVHSPGLSWDRQRATQRGRGVNEPCYLRTARGKAWLLRADPQKCFLIFDISCKQHSIPSGREGFSFTDKRLCVALKPVDPRLSAISSRSIFHALGTFIQPERFRERLYGGTLPPSQRRLFISIHFQIRAPSNFAEVPPLRAR